MVKIMMKCGHEADIVAPAAADTGDAYPCCSMCRAETAGHVVDKYVEWQPVATVTE